MLVTGNAAHLHQQFSIGREEHDFAPLGMSDQHLIEHEFNELTQLRTRLDLAERQPLEGRDQKPQVDRSFSDPLVDLLRLEAGDTGLLGQPLVAKGGAQIVVEKVSGPGDAQGKGGEHGHEQPLSDGEDRLGS